MNRGVVVRGGPVRHQEGDGHALAGRHDRVQRGAAGRANVNREVSGRVRGVVEHGLRGDIKVDRASRRGGRDGGDLLDVGGFLRRDAARPRKGL